MTRLIIKGYILSLITTLLFIESASAQSQEIRLWPGKAPGSESWSVSESVTTSPSGDRTVSNVSDPTLTVFLPDPANATGAAIVIAPKPRPQAGQAAGACRLAHGAVQQGLVRNWKSETRTQTRSPKMRRSRRCCGWASPTRSRR